MKSHLIAVASGVLGGAVPNNKSNIHPLLMGAILAVFLTKVLVGDWDAGYQWSVYDIGFLVVTAIEGALGAAMLRAAS